MKAAPTQDLGFILVEDRVDVVLIHVEQGTELAQPFCHRCQRYRFVVGPWHPRPQVLQARTGGFP